MNKKISSLVGIAVIVVVAAVAGLIIAYQNWQEPEPVAQSTPTPTPSQSGTPVPTITPNPTPTPTVDQYAGWRTYRNEEYGFELKYPKTWVVKENTLPDNSPLFSFSIIQGQYEPSVFRIRVVSKNLNDFISEYNESYKTYCNEPIKRTKVLMVGGSNAVDLLGCGGYEFIGENMIFIEKEQVSFIIYPDSPGPIDTLSEARQNFPLFLSSFRFIK